MWNDDDWNLLENRLYMVKDIYNSEWAGKLIYMIAVEEKHGNLDFNNYAPATEQEQFLYHLYGSEALINE